MLRAVASAMWVYGVNFPPFLLKQSSELAAFSTVSIHYLDNQAQSKQILKYSDKTTISPLPRLFKKQKQNPHTLNSSLVPSAKEKEQI